MKQHAVLLFILSLLICACTEVIEVDFPSHEPLLVVNCRFNPDSVWHVEVSASREIGSPESYQFVDNAIVEIYEGNRLIDQLEYQGKKIPTKILDIDRGIEIDTFLYENETVYRSGRNVTPKPSIDYTIKVTAPGFPIALATDRIPINPEFSLQSIEIKSDTRDGKYNSNQFLEITTIIQDKAESEDYYFIRAYVPDSTYQYIGDQQVAVPYNRLISIEDVFDIQAVQLNEMWIFSDQSFFGTNYPLRIGLDGLQIGDEESFVVQIGAVSTSFYRYYTTYQEQRFYGNGLVTLTDPPKVYNNINGGLGVFAGYNNQELTIKGWR